MWSGVRSLVSAQGRWGKGTSIAQDLLSPSLSSRLILQEMVGSAHPTNVLATAPVASKTRPTEDTRSGFVNPDRSVREIAEQRSAERIPMNRGLQRLVRSAHPTGLGKKETEISRKQGSLSHSPFAHLILSVRLIVQPNLRTVATGRSLLQ